MDPRVLLFGLVSAAIWIGTVRSLVGAGVWVAVLAAALLLTRSRRAVAGPIPRRWWLWALAATALTVGLYAVWPGAVGESLPAAGSQGPLAGKGLAAGVRMGLRLFAFMLLATLTVSLVAPMRLAAGVTRMLLPLRRIGLPVESMFFFVFFLVRMFPQLVAESWIIRLAQRSRGIRFSGSWKKKLQASLAVVIPVLGAGLRRSESLSMSLAARGFDERRIPLAVKSLRLGALDLLLGFLVLCGWSLWFWQRFR